MPVQYDRLTCPPTSTITFGVARLGIISQEGTSFFCSAIANVDPRAPLVEKLAPLNSDLKNLEVFKTAYANAAARLKKGWKNPESRFSSEKQRMRVAGNSCLEAKANVEGSGVTVWSSGKVAFLWKSPENENYSFAILGSKSLIPAAGDHRYISFTDEGICLLDSNREMLLRRDQKVDDQATWTKQYLSRMKEADTLRQLWEHHVPEGEWIDVLETPNDTPETLPASFFHPKGRPPLRQKQSGIEHYATPPNPGDGTWIIHEFLREFIGPVGGRLFTGNLDFFPELEPHHLKAQLKAFIQQPRYQNYPWLHIWTDWVEDGKGATLHIRENVKFCRDITTRQQNKAGKFNGKWWILGPKKQRW
jgi:hypothetical protein